jgi:hypothetical protein
MADPREKTLSASSPIALGLAATALAGVLAAGVAVGDARNRLATVEKDAAKADSRIEKVEGDSAAHAIRDAAVEADVRNIRQSLDNIDRKLDRMLERRGVVRTGGPE